MRCLVPSEVSLSFLLRVPLLSSLLDAQHPRSAMPFGVLVAAGAVVGGTVASRHARDRGLNPQRTTGFVWAVMVGGFLGGHLLDALLYHCYRVIADPASVLRTWDGLSTFGAVAGVLLGAMVWHRRTGAPILPYAEAVSSAFPMAWMFGRAGCALVHHHPGRPSDAWYAVAYPTAEGLAGRFDPALYELLLTVPVAVLFLMLWRRGPRRLGFYTGTMCVIYALMRFSLDFLRADEGSSVSADPRFLWLTPTQWTCLVLLPLGLYVLQRAPPRERLVLNHERLESAG